MAKERNAVVTVGTFDGVHVGHQAILRFLTERARIRGGTPVLVTFDPHPRQIVTGDAVPLLTTPEERGALASSLGIRETVVLPFDKAMAQVPAERFVEEILVDRIGLSCIVIGHDHGFGAGRRGNRELLEAMGPDFGFTVDVIPPQVVEETVVSSSTIRRGLEQDGDVAAAAAMLGRPYRWQGIVVQGDQRGRAIGYPTANLLPRDKMKLIPARGVYAVTVRLATGDTVPGMMNIGTRPTFDGVKMHQEVHILDFDGDLYGSTLTVEFRERLRTEQKFHGIEALVRQLAEDESRCRALLTGLL